MNPSRATIPLILFTLALSFAAVALIVNGTLQAPTLKDIATACSDTFAQAQTPATCPEVQPVAPETLTTPPSTSYPGFTYPLGWNAVLTTSATQSTIVLAPAGLFASCADCQNTTVVTIATEPYSLTGSETLDSRVQAMYADNTSAVIQKAVQGNGTKYTITGSALTAPFGSFTHVRFFGATTQSAVLILESDLFPSDTAEYTSFLSSLDFSLIP